MNQAHLVEICDFFTLGVPIAKPSRVYGGLLHCMWKITTDKSMYAVKQLSQDIPLKEARISNNYELTEQIAVRFAKQGIPAIAALEKLGKHLLEVEGTYFLIYPWVNARTLDTQIISEYHALKIAETLAKIHQINLTAPRLEELPFEPYTTERLLNLIKKVEDCCCPFAADLRACQVDLIAIKDAYEHSIVPLKRQRVMSHGDLDQKNVLWDENNQPILIDWEAACALNPLYDLVNTALNWSGIISDAFDQALFLKMIDAYIAIGGVIDKNLLPVAFDGACGWIHWLIYNIERSCVSGESEQKRIGIGQVNQTLPALMRLRKVTPELIELMNIACLR